MNRRLFVTWISGALVGLKAASEEQNLQIERQMELGSYGDEVLLGVAGSADHVYALHRDGANRRTYSLTCSLLSGEFTWTVPLSGGDFSQLSSTRNGNCMVLMLERAATPQTVVHEYGPTGSLLRSSKLTSGMVFASRLSDGKVVTFSGNGAVRTHDFRSGGVLREIPGVVRPVSIGGQVPRYLAAFIEMITDDVAVVIDQITGQVARLELSAGAAQTAAIDDPAIQYGLESGKRDLDSLKKAVGDKKPSGTRRVSFGTPVVIHASAGDATGGIYCMMSPIDAVRPLVLKIDSHGKVLRRFRCPLPNRADKKDKVLIYLAAWPNRLLLAFQDGTAVTYSFQG